MQNPPETTTTFLSMSLINFLLDTLHLLKKENCVVSLLMPTQLVLIALEICVYGESNNLIAQGFFGDIVVYFHYTL